ncbi:hypothetical protein [Mycobacterium talmoniae]|uniref:Uncharacterized protein n=1 Tax=Mycobacterium talmoniae TaxID=1858794 RepID=A0A1S1NGU3_9MYCO|nr:MULTISPECIES: hypothetical protein [Mycobacterium]OHV04971.1 hypothetical protein BKN37_07560 [Mycobacterium talmoniae]PQM48336.1 hypothetical protein C1Y40_01450 [Mycobacterium talmoniae]TDH53109.1 hypothetical protein E2F47_13180 [Mycobacterium eburneum]
MRIPWRKGRAAPVIRDDQDRQRLVRQLAVEALRRRGVQVRPAPEDVLGDDWLVGQDGYQYRLYNLQLVCSQLPQADWAARVEFHFDQMLAGRSAPDIGELSEPELLAQIRTRLQPKDGSGLQSLGYVRPAFDGLVVELNRDLPTTVVTLGDSSVDGRDLDFLYQVGQRNTNAEPTTSETVGPGVLALTGDSFFIASKALDMPHLVASLFGAAPLGVVFSVPHRSLLFLHPVGPHTLEAVQWLAPVTLGQTQEPPGGAVSRDTYYWHGGVVQPITRLDNESAAIEIRVEGMFGEALSQL